MSRYLEILAVQRPFPIGADENQRTMFSMNFHAVAAQPVAKFEEEIARVLFDAGLAVLGTNATIGPIATMKTTDPSIHIMDTGGMFPLETHNGGKYERLSCQIIVRSANYFTARTRALAIWRALDGLRNTELAAI